MFKRNVQPLKELVLKALHDQGLQTPLNQRRLLALWPEVAGPLVARYTQDTFIYNQTLVVRLSSPALRADLSMRRAEFTRMLNERVGEQVISDIRFA